MISMTPEQQEAAILLLRRLAWETEFEDVRGWFSGDGPAEEYWSIVSCDAGEFLKSLGIHPTGIPFTYPTNDPSN